jgi:N-acyl-D-amino-acid deacylase
LLETGARGSADQRTCFTCHHQALPVLALAEARKRGFTVDLDNFQRQLTHTAAHLERGRKKYLEDSGQGGKVITAGYALWTLEAGQRPPDETTAAVTHFLLQYQQDADHWSHPGDRPPASGSEYTATYIALRGLAVFGTEKQQPEIEARNLRVRDWLLSESPSDTEDRVFRLWSLPYVDVEEQIRQQAIAELIGSQRDDGGWAQRADGESDAYATGTVLVVLQRAGDFSADHPAVRRGVRYLVDSQLDDGSWHVVTRAKPFQTYFESGFPHGKDQFISITASSWATLALLLTLPESASSNASSVP